MAIVDLPEHDEDDFFADAVAASKQARRKGKKEKAPKAPLAPGAKKPWYQQEFYVGRAVKAELVMNFTRQAASFIRSGIPILDALAIVEEETTDKKLRETLLQMQMDIRGGMSFGEAVARHPKVFPGYYIAMVRSADLTGQLDDALENLAEYLDRDESAKRAIKSSLTYPGFVMGLALVSMTIMAIWVLPKFKTLYASLDAELPLPTRMLLGLTDLFTNYWFVMLGILIVLGVAGYGLLGGAHGKDRRDRLILRLPVLGKLFHLIAVERFCRVLSAMVNAGVALPDAVRVAADSTNNRVFQGKLEVVRESMMRGLGLAAPLAEAKLFPAAARQMIRVGESTGTLDRQLESASIFYSRELVYRLKKATDLFEPIVIVGVGVIVGFVAVAQVSAMYAVFNQVQ